VGLSRRQHQFDWIAQGVNEGVDFGRQSAAGSTDRLLAVFFEPQRYVGARGQW
jgi:hypothetical protein